MIRFAVVAMLLPACALPLEAETSVVFQADDSLLLAAEVGAEQFAAIYPGAVEVTTADDGSEGPAVRSVRVRLVAPGFMSPHSARPMCQVDAGGTRVSGRTGDDVVWICDDMSPERTQAVLIHEMCHVFGAPGFPHWDGEGGACSGRGDTGVISRFEKQEFKAMWKGM